MTAAERIHQIKHRLKGSHTRRGLIASAALYMVLIFVSFVFLYPILIMVSGSAKDVHDLANPIVRWIPSRIHTLNYVQAYVSLGGISTLFESFRIVLFFAIAQTVSSALIGYGLAKYNFWGNKLLLILILVTFILPPQTTFLARYVMFVRMDMLRTILPVLLPAFFGQGLNSAIFILIFYQFFRMAPRSLDESAFIDGAGHITTFLRINMRLAVPAVVVVFIFSYVWNWNETDMSASFFGPDINTVPLALERFQAQFTLHFPEAAANPLLRMNEGLLMAGTLLSILPLIVLYVIVERQLVESIDKAGITGE
jgi:multiple sugar transport system permease protein